VVIQWRGRLKKKKKKRDEVCNGKSNFEVVDLTIRIWGECEWIF